ncbi:MAG: GntR family transcriptional regulator [Thermaceae bacterium]|nr:GntR family transcriptional regulator [Thermaceae bacterium]
MIKKSFPVESDTETINIDQQVYEQIKRAIFDHRLPPGTKLTEEKLSDLFAVSRERIRKVLQRLSYDKCVSLKPNRGAYVAQPSVQEARDVFATRGLIESHIVELVVQNATEADYAHLEQNIAREYAAHQQGRLNEAIALSGEFHLLLAEISRNIVLLDILRDLVARSSLIIAMYGRQSFSLCGYEDHQVFLKRLKTRQVQQAKKLMQEHLRTLEAQLYFEARSARDIDLTEVFKPKA